MYILYILFLVILFYVIFRDYFEKLMRNFIGFIYKNYTQKIVFSFRMLFTVDVAL